MRSVVMGCLLVACTKAPSPMTDQPSPPTPMPAPALASPLKPVAVGTGVYGTAHPTFIRAFDRVSSRWMALCQARKDTDGDGSIGVTVGHHGGIHGDAMALYLVIGGGDGIPIDAFVDRSDDDRWILALRGTSVILVDTSTGDVTELADADVETDNRPGAPHRAGRIAAGRAMFVRHRKTDDALVIHELASHTEREVVLSERIWRVGEAGTFAAVYTVKRDAGFPVLETTLDAGECNGEAASSSSYGQRGPKPTERWVDLDKGAVVTAPTTPPAPAPRITPVKLPALADDDMAGPVHWK